MWLLLLLLCLCAWSCCKAIPTAGGLTRLVYCLDRAELRLKSDKWHREACDPVNPDVAADLEEKVAQAGLCALLVW